MNEYTTKRKARKQGIKVTGKPALQGYRVNYDGLMKCGWSARESGKEQTKR